MGRRARAAAILFSASCSPTLVEDASTPTLGDDDPTIPSETLPDAPENTEESDADTDTDADADADADGDSDADSDTDTDTDTVIDTGGQVGCEPGADPNGNLTNVGEGAWENWCIDDPDGVFTTDEGNKGLESNSQAIRDAGGGWANTVRMSCEVKFPEDWVVALFEGGQHLGGLGIGPRRDDENNYIRLDICAPNDDDGEGFSFRDGVDFIVYETRDGERRETVGRANADDVFLPGVWTELVIEATYDPDEGLMYGTVEYGGTTVVPWEIEAYAGNPHKLGEFVVWGNIDGRDDAMEIRNLTYEFSE